MITSLLISIGVTAALETRADAVRPAPPEGPVIVKLVARGRTITVRATSGRAGPAYSVASSDGAVIAANVSLDELRRLDPAAYEQVRWSITSELAEPASSRSDANSAIWAGADRD
jgi:hypothetical protein